MRRLGLGKHSLLWLAFAGVALLVIALAVEVLAAEPIAEAPEQWCELRAYLDSRTCETELTCLWVRVWDVPGGWRRWRYEPQQRAQRSWERGCP